SCRLAVTARGSGNQRLRPINFRYRLSAGSTTRPATRDGCARARGSHCAKEHHGMIAIRNTKVLPERRWIRGILFCLLCLGLSKTLSFADEPYARSKEYDLDHSRIALRFDLSEKRVFGDVTHDLTILRATSEIAFDSVGLSIDTVNVNKAKAKFETTKDKL